MATRLDPPRPGHAPCHACLLLADKSRSLNARSSWRRICDSCTEQYVNKPLPVPPERVRYCPDTLGLWGQSREIYQSWDTGLGAVVPARKYNLAPVPAGKVAVVLQDAADAQTVDRLLGPLATKPEKPFMLRYCSSIKSFCADDCFSSSQDKSCLAHIKQRKSENGMPRCPEIKGGSSRRDAAKSEEACVEVPENRDNGWLLNEIPTLWDGNGDDCFGDFALGDIYDLSAPALLSADDPLACFQSSGGPSRSASPTDTVETMLPTPRESPDIPREVAHRGEAILNGLNNLLGGGAGAEADASWTQSAVDVAFDDALGAALKTATPPRGFTVPRGLQPPKASVQRQVSKGANAPASKQCMWAPGTSKAKPLISKAQDFKPIRVPTKLPPKPAAAGASRHGPTQKAKCVWKQQIMW